MSFNEDKYLIFAKTERNKELWDFIREEIRLTDDVEPFKYKRDFMKIKFRSDDKVPINEILNISVCVLIIKSVTKSIHKFT